MSCSRKIEPGPMFMRHRVPGNSCPGVKITAQLLNTVTFTIVRSARKIENGLTNGLTTTSGVGLTTPKNLMRTSSQAAARGIHERTRARAGETSWGEASLSARSERIGAEVFIARASLSMHIWLDQRSQF